MKDWRYIYQQVYCKFLLLCLVVLDMNTGIQDTERNKPVFYPEIHAEFIIKMNVRI